MTITHTSESETRVLWDSISDSVIVVLAIFAGFALGLVLVAWLMPPAVDVIPRL
jgi:hypothetical protein